MMDRDHDFGAADAPASIGKRCALRSFPIAAYLILDTSLISPLATVTDANRTNITFTCNVTLDRSEHPGTLLTRAKDHEHAV